VHSRERPEPPYEVGANAEPGVTSGDLRDRGTTSVTVLSPSAEYFQKFSVGPSPLARDQILRNLLVRQFAPDYKIPSPKTRKLPRAVSRQRRDDACFSKQQDNPRSERATETAVNRRAEQPDRVHQLLDAGRRITTNTTPAQIRE
jgi:hypothetical protein